jgi:gluconate 5-dehydrogenase
MWAKFKLDGKVGIVTGAAQGLGEVFAEALAEAGADLVIITRTQIAKLKNVAKRITSTTGRRIIPIKADVTREADVREMILECHRNFQRLDFIINNAGIVISKPILQLTLEEWKEVIDINLTGTFICCKEAVRYMIEHQCKGSIVNIASGYGEVVDLIPNAPYYASKAGIIHLTKALACELGPHGIRVNALSPGWFPTPMGKELFQNHLWVQHMCRKIPLKRLGKLEDLKPLIVFMVSDAAEYISGHVFKVLGGPVEIAEPVCTGLKYLEEIYGSEYVRKFKFV